MFAPTRRLMVAVAAAAITLSASGVFAQTVTNATETTDVGDLWRLARHVEQQPPKHNRFLVIAPSIGSKPSTGLSAGFSSNVAFFSGDPANTRISSLQAGIKVTQKKQTNLGSRLALFTSHDRWFLLAENRISWTSQNTYALGSDAPLSSAANAKFNNLRLYESAYRQVRHGLFVGGGLNVSDHSDIRPGHASATPWANSEFMAYSLQHGFSPDHQNSSGTSVGVRLDTRDNGINADHGWLGSATYRTFFNGFLGGDSTWQELAVDVRTYKKLTDDARHKLAFWFLGDAVTGGTAPFFDLPSAGADGRSARGYSDGRFRGDHLVYGEAEYRGTLTANRLLGFVVFANVTSVDDPRTGTGVFKTFAPGGGVGLRVLLNKRSKTNLCTDYAWGKLGARGFYLSIQEAF